MKKILKIFILLSIIFCLSSNVYAVEPHVQGVMVNETWVNLDMKPVFSFTTMDLYLPLEEIASAFGFNYSYDSNSGLNTINTNTKTLWVYDGGKRVTCSDNSVIHLQSDIGTTEYSPKKHFIYYKDIATMFETSSEWLETTECVYINSPIAYNYYSMDERIEKRYSNMGWLYDSLTRSQWYYDGYDWSYYEYHVPEINIKSLDAIKLSKKIYNNYISEINENIEWANDRSTADLCLVDYQDYGTDEFLSVLVHRFYDGGCYNIYDAYTISKTSGKIKSNTDLIARTGYTTEQFLEVIKPMMANKFYEHNSELSNWDEDFYWKQYYYTINTLRNLNMPMFVGNNNHLWIVPSIGSIAGGDSYQYIIDTGLTIW